MFQLFYFAYSCDLISWHKINVAHSWDIMQWTYCETRCLWCSLFHCYLGSCTSVRQTIRKVWWILMDFCLYCKCKCALETRWQLLMCVSALLLLCLSAIVQNFALNVVGFVKASYDVLNRKSQMLSSLSCGIWCQINAVATAKVANVMYRPTISY